MIRYALHVPNAPDDNPIATSSLPLAAHIGVLLLMAASQFAAWAIVIIGAPQGILFPIVPVPAFLLAVLALRLRQPRPVDIPASDWGNTLGHRWVVLGHRTHWVRASELPALIAETEAIEPKWTHAGFELSIPSQASGLPDLSTLLIPTMAALIGPLMVVTFVLGAVDPSVGAMQTAMMPLVAALCGVLGYGGSLLPWVALYTLFEWWRAPESPRRVELHGRTVRMGDQTFVLGRPGQKMVLDDGRLVLTAEGETFVIRGAGAHLAFLKTAFEQVSAAPTSTEAEVPEALQRLQAAKVTG